MSSNLKNPMKTSKKRLTFDFETRSACDLKKAGAYKYSLDPTTIATCLAAKFHGDPEILFLDFDKINLPWQKVPAFFRAMWETGVYGKYEFSAHNAFFERCIYNNVLVKRLGWPEIPFESYRCTAAKAASCALPRNLQGAGEAMDLRVQKDFRGYAAMMKTCKPTKEWVAWKKNIGFGASKLFQPPMFLEPEHAPDVWKTLYDYCKIDVLSEEELDDSLPDLNPDEQKLWHLNQTLNWRGLRIDIPTVKKIVGIMEVESKKKLKDLDSLTMGLVTKPGARNSILEFLEIEGVKLPNLQKKTVEDSLEGFDLPPTMRELLQIRKALSLTSTRKYQSFLNRANDDDRVRDIMMFHGASTGRDTGTGIQPHNLPKPLLEDKDIEFIIELLQGAE